MQTAFLINEINVNVIWVQHEGFPVCSQHRIVILVQYSIIHAFSQDSSFLDTIHNRRLVVVRWTVVCTLVLRAMYETVKYFHSFLHVDIVFVFVTVLGLFINPENRLIDNARCVPHDQHSVIRTREETTSSRLEYNYKFELTVLR